MLFNYDNIFWMKYNVYPLPLLGIRGKWDSMPENPLQTQIVIAGLTFHLQPENWGKGEKEKKNKEEKKKKNEKKRSKKSLSFPAVLRSLDRDFLGSIKMLIGDLLRMLRPKKLEIRGKFGFSDPHYNGWLAALIYMLEESCEVSNLQIDPVWEEEHYEFSFIIEGSITIGLMLFRVARFILARKTRVFIKMLRKERKASSIA